METATVNNDLLVLGRLIMSLGEVANHIITLLSNYIGRPSRMRLLLTHLHSNHIVTRFVRLSGRWEGRPSRTGTPP